jgi:hypothetical protein
MHIPPVNGRVGDQCPAVQRNRQGTARTEGAGLTGELGFPDGAGLGAGLGLSDGEGLGGGLGLPDGAGLPDDPLPPRRPAGRNGCGTRARGDAMVTCGNGWLVRIIRDQAAEQRVSRCRGLGSAVGAVGFFAVSRLTRAATPSGIAAGSGGSGALSWAITTSTGVR